MIIFFYAVRRGSSHCIEENVVPTSKFPRGVLAVNNSRSFSCTQFPLGRRTRSQAAIIICAAALVMFFTLILNLSYLVVFSLTLDCNILQFL
jgi:hypothetical protein